MRRTLLILGLAIATTLTPRAAYAVKVADITRMAGSRTNVLTGMGLVIGLKGTGDGGAYLPAIKPLAQMLGKFADPATVVDLANANNVAMVMVTATIPKDGVRSGDALDVRVMSAGAATSLRGGTLYMAPLLGPTGLPYTPHDASGAALRPIPFALANGPVDMDDLTVPTSGVVKGAAVMEVDLPAKYIDRLGRFTLILDGPSASWPMASTIADRINQLVDNGEIVAVAVDPKNVVVRVPTADRERPDLFISEVQRLTIPMLPGEARVRINDKTGAMVATGDVEIAPFLISYKGLTITSVAPAPPAAGATAAPSRGTVPVDPAGSGAARMRDLADAFDQLKVPAEDRIHIMKELYENGELHAKLIVDGAEK
jgi:flagellar P-ring protein precursor FlgI